MLESMTGFAETEFSTPAGRIKLTIITLNHRQLDIHLNLPPELENWKYWILKELEKKIRRGRVFLNMGLETYESAWEVDVEKERVKKYRELLQSLGEGNIELTSLLRLPGVLKFKWKGGKGLRKRLKEELDKLVEKLLEMRRKEGKELEKDICKRLEKIKELVNYIRKKRARKKREELPPEISEELTRLSSHLKASNREIRKKESSGIKLDFLAQEMLREANAIASKIQDARLAYKVVEIKVEIDRIREQLRNVV
ncbi:DUF1732 domain-containing protein [Candidatus Calescamantes bacterium]|nr:DUF1732 domain-containing protein [Candidatus Calescamantes bacterium]